MSVLLVVAKAPVPGQVKTRLCPPATPRQAAAIAAAALLDTLDAAAATPLVLPVLAYTGRFADAEAAFSGAGAAFSDPGAAFLDATVADEIRAALAGWRLVPQRGDGLADRLANAHADVARLYPGHPVLQIGMDTPQVRPGLLSSALHRLASADAVLGPAADGGWWALGLRDPRHATALRQVPMSTPDTGRLTRSALAGLGLRIADLPVLSDVDTWSDALTVAADAPDTRFANRLWLVDSAGQRAHLPVHRWHGTAEPAVQAVVDRCTGPTVDVGCGPGRVTAELAGRGVISLGIDISPAAIRLTRRRGAAALRRNVFDPLPGEGRWSHVLLLDGNIGIGGDPAVLLRRCASLLRHGGTVLVELDARQAGHWQGQATVESERHRGQSFRWARLGVEAIHHVAAQAQLTIRALFQGDNRWFAELERP